MTKGQIISGEFGKILMRQKSEQDIELGELLIADSNDKKILMQVYDLIYGSQISQQNLELISGLNLEENTDMDFIDPNLRNYKLALLKSLIAIDGEGARIAKTLPGFFSTVREIKKADLSFLTKPKYPLFLGKLRSGSKTLDVDIFLDGRQALSHHILIPATTGRGKSNLTSCILYNLVDADFCGILVLDPHDEYYGRNGLGLKDHPSKDKVVFYTPKNVPPGALTLKINVESIKPMHFNGAVSWSDPQQDALYSFYKKYSKEWISAIAWEKPVDGSFHEATLGVVRRKIMNLLGLRIDGSMLVSHGIFDLGAGKTTIKDIVNELEKAKTVIVDTSNFSGSVEILIGSMLTHEILSRYKYHKIKGELDNKPVISIVIEEAPRVLGKDVLKEGTNIFETVAREGRKFKVGLIAITQLPSLIPRQILANINTKIILGIEMQPERQAIIESAAQDLSEDNRNIASLDRGEAIVTSNFARFATPIKIPLFSDIVQKKEEVNKDFSGIKS